MITKEAEGKDVLYKKFKNRIISKFKNGNFDALEKLINREPMMRSKIF